MRKGIFIVIFLFIAGEAFAQSWTPGQYTEFKGVIANEVLRIPRRDTIALGGNKDSVGQIIYRPQDTTVYIKTPIGWHKIVGPSKPPIQPIRFDAVFGFDGLAADGMSYVNPTLIGAAVQAVRVETDDLIRVKTLGDPPLFDEWDFDPLTGTIYFGSPLPDPSGYSIRMTIIYLK